MWATAAEINASKTHCPRLHPYDKANTYVNPAGKRQCRRCHAIQQAAYKARRAVVNAPSAVRAQVSANDQEQRP